MITGTIESVKRVDDTLVCVVDFGAGLVEQCTLHGGAGMAEWPIAGDEATVDMGAAENVIVAVFRPVPGALGAGEKWIFGRDASGEIKSSIKMKSDGTMILNDGTDYAVAFNELKAGFDQLVSFVNSMVLPVSGAAAGPVAIPSFASIDGAKVQKVKV